MAAVCVAIEFIKVGIWYIDCYYSTPMDISFTCYLSIKVYFSVSTYLKGDKKHKVVNGEGSETKHLRFFGDSDRESHKSARGASPSSHLRESSPNPHLLQVCTNLAL